MASKKDETTSLNLPALGEEGEACAECGSALAIDQRYCLNCGTRRTGPRLDFARVMPAPAGATAAMPMVGAGGGGLRTTSNRDWTIAGVGLIAIMGIFLLVGVLIGHDNDGGTTQVSAPAAATAAPTAAPTTAAVGAGDPGAKAAKAAGAGAGAAVKGGSGSTAGIPAADTSAKTGKAASDAAKNGPDVVATSGPTEQQDPNGEAGGGSPANCIGGPC